MLTEPPTKLICAASGAGVAVTVVVEAGLDVDVGAIVADGWAAETKMEVADEFTVAPVLSVICIIKLQLPRAV